MRTLTDALLSVQKYVYEALGSSWEVRLWQDRGEIVPGASLALVLKVGDTASVGSALYADVTQPMAVHCYPFPKPNADASILQACAVEEQLQTAFRFEGVGLGRPLRVPLYDYSEVVDPVLEDSGVRWDNDYMRVEGFSTTQIPEPDDPRRIRVVAGFNVRWVRVGRVPSGTTLESVSTSAAQTS